MGKRRNRRWATLEAETAAALGGRRVTTPWHLFEVRPDFCVDLPTGLRLVGDSKAYAKSAACTLIDNIRSKYCQSERDVPIAVIKPPHKEAVAILPLTFVAGLLKERNSHA